MTHFKSATQLQSAAKLAGFALAAGTMIGTAVAQDIKIGAVLSVTGPASFLGDHEEMTLKMYVEEINAKGFKAVTSNMRHLKSPPSCCRR